MGVTFVLAIASEYCTKLECTISVCSKIFLSQEKKTLITAYAENTQPVTSSHTYIEQQKRR